MQADKGLAVGITFPVLKGTSLIESTTKVEIVTSSGLLVALGEWSNSIKFIISVLI